MTLCSSIWLSRNFTSISSSSVTTLFIDCKQNQCYRFNSRWKISTHKGKGILYCVVHINWICYKYNIVPPNVIETSSVLLKGGTYIPVQMLKSRMASHAWRGCETNSTIVKSIPLSDVPLIRKNNYIHNEISKRLK